MTVGIAILIFGVIFVCVMGALGAFEPSAPETSDEKSDRSRGDGEGLVMVGDPTHGFSDDEVDSAALKLVYGCPEGTSAWMGGTVEKNEAALAEVQRRRQQYVNYEPVRMRRAIMKWFDYYERQCRKKIEECRTYDADKERRERAEREEKGRARDRRVQELTDRLRDAKNPKGIL